MVVNRKQPVAPAPTISRSSSTQPVPTKRRQLKNATPSHSAKTQLPPRKTKKRRSSLIDRLVLYSLSLFTLYAFYTCRPNPIFSTPTHHHSIDPNPLCRSLSSYRIHVLDPYVIPPIKHALTFSHSLAEPYIQSTKVRVDPYIAPVVHTVTTVKPYVVRTAESVKALWQGTLVPLYQHTLKPYYQNAVVPRYNLYIHPYLQPLAHKTKRYYAYYVSRPLHIKAVKAKRYVRAKYTGYIQPYIRLIQRNAQDSFNMVQTVTIQLVDTYKIHAHPRLVAAWIEVRPALCITWTNSKRLTLQFANLGSKQLKKATNEADAYRRTYVDPHVRKIWDKVAEGTELSSFPASTPPLARDLPDSEATTESIPEPTPVVPLSSSTIPIPTTSDETEAGNINLADTTVPMPEEAVTPVGAPNTPPPPVNTPSSPQENEKAERDAQYALSMAKASAHGASTVVQGFEHELEESVHVHSDSVHQNQVFPLSASAAIATELPVEPTTVNSPAPEDGAEDPLLSTTASKEIVTPQPEPSPRAERIEDTPVDAAEATGRPGAADDEDLEDFLRDLGVEEQVTSTAETSSLHPDSQQPHQQQQTPEDVERAHAEKLAETAAKRAGIVSRHEAWFVRLDEAVKEEGPALAEALNAWRSEKKAELLKMSGKTEGGKPVLEEIQKEGERLLRGLEAYLKKAEARSAAWKLSDAPSTVSPDEDREVEAKKAAVAEKDKWETVLSKVEGKFSDRVRAVQAEVHQWYVDALEHERQEVQTSAARVKHVAERAQADIGLDYAWLEDVTFKDWQRYHDLIRIAERYEHTAYALQNGTSIDPPSPPAPLVPALDTLHSELQDVVLGFSVTLGALRGDAAKVFSQRTDAEGGDDGGFFVVNDGQVRKDDLRGVDLGLLGLGGGAAGVVPVPSGADEGDQVRILPIDPDPVEIPKDSEGEGVVDASTIVIGKDPVQIEQALKDVPLEPPAARHEEL